MTGTPGYSPLFNPDAPQPASFDAGRVIHRADEAPAGGYVYDPEGRIALAVNVALATGRPLLVEGQPGSGKSSLAADVARRLNWRYYETTITSRMRARDLLWLFDAIRRLNDAQAKSLKDLLDYITPGVLWWAFSSTNAAMRGLSDDELARRGLTRLHDPSPRPGTRAVVLLDEIDKADPDVPNDLLLPLGALRFEVTEDNAGRTVTADAPPLVFITTNQERDLPSAFLRRCIVLHLPDPSGSRIVEIAVSHFGDRVPREQLSEMLEAYEEVRKRRTLSSYQPNLAEYLDAVAAAAALGVGAESGDVWDQLIEFALRKAPPEGSA